jgi:hypothetical protein
MTIMEESLPNIKSFFKGTCATASVHSMITRFMISILCRHGRNSCMNAASIVRDQGLHRAQPSRFLSRIGWRAMDLLGQLSMKLLAGELWSGQYLLIIDSVLVGHQGKTMENTYSTGNRKRRPRKGRRYNKQKHAAKGCHCFVFAVLITPDGTRIPFYKPLYTKGYAKQKKLKRKTQAQLGAQMIDELPVPAGTSVMVLGDTAFDAQVIRKACDRRGYDWIFPCNANRVFAGPRGKRKRVSSRISKLSNDLLTTIRISQTGGKYAAQRRLSQHRSNAKRKTRTYYVHSEKRQVHSVGQTMLVFSSTKLNRKKPKRESTKILMTNAMHLSAREVVELYRVRWQIELFFKELKSILGMHQYKFKRFEAVEGWMDVVLITFVYLEWTRMKKLADKRIKKQTKEIWRRQRAFGIRQAILIGIEIREQRWIQKRIKSKHGLKVLAKSITKLLAREYRCVA